MSKHDFTAAEFADRLARVRAAMAARDLDWLIAVHPASIHWLTGSDAKSYQEFQCLLVGARNEPLVVLTRQGEVHEFETDSGADEVHGFGGGENEDPVAAFADVARRHDVLGRRVGLEVPAYYLHPHHCLGLRAVIGDTLLAEATELIAGLKLVKSPAEIAYIRRAAALADLGMERFAGEFAAGLSELALAGTIHETLLRNGSGIAASPINLVSGPRSAYSHGAPTARRLEHGDFGNLEFGATFNRYTATIGRNFALGKPTPRMAELHDIVLRAGDAMIAAIRDGVPATVPHQAARAVIGEAGLEACRVHTSGYALGPGFPPSWAEPLHMIGDSPHMLKAGMVVTIEPPVYIGAEGLGARIIDNVLVTTAGAEVLSRTPRDIIVAG
ncbi:MULTISPECIES: Xaa-Pro peptidase family protein [unclassified Mesorhizobium]|uniref:M24 family metallopeptidase n=1 Tax=unclassified Mesorhizobium TaxID=325217 RepID=UPI00112CD9EF|nr:MULTISPECIES: Xaa-Pro peptidase family protein [unclassified Mesorhizobium]MBZ9982436.1 Xaa-Pro peptidase family protein [Mesorhizobium sp. BR-1-1-8]TPL32302.1 aminopeptidase P family protein [Mesorhizobium sp. B2-4-8]TPL61118.1 aminopeptidase P family protein [Mesorhizobium sp. B2-4-1]